MMATVHEMDPWRRATQRRLASLELMQERRLVARDQRVAEMDEVITRRQREIENLRATLEAGE